MSAALVISNTAVRQDAAGRYCLNDLHRAAGGNKRHSPSRWTRSDGYRDLVAELTPEMEFDPAVSVRGGASPGTYVCDDLVYAYAMWVSAKFCLRVIRAYKSQTGQELRQSIGLMHQRLALEARDAGSKVRASFGSHLMLDRKRELPAIKDERAKLETEMQPGLFRLTAAEPT